MHNNQTIVILGGGVGGVVSAVELRKKASATTPNIRSSRWIWTTGGSPSPTGRKLTLMCSHTCRRTARLALCATPGWWGIAVGSQ